MTELNRDGVSFVRPEREQLTFYARRLWISPRPIKFSPFLLNSAAGGGEDAGVAGSRFTSRQENVNRDTTFVTHPRERDVGILSRVARFELLGVNMVGRRRRAATEEIARWIGSSGTIKFIRLDIFESGLRV